MNARPGFRGRGDKRFETRAEQRVDQLRLPPQSVEAEQAPSTSVAATAAARADLDHLRMDLLALPRGRT